MSQFLIFLIAILTSAASAVVGLGGGLLLIPFIILIFDLPVKYVAGTMLLAMVPYTAVATFRNMKNGYINFKIGLTMEMGSVLGVLLGAHFTEFFPDILLKSLFIIIVIYLMFTLQISQNSPHNYVARGFSLLNRIPPFMSCDVKKERHCSIPALIFIGLIAGFFSGLLGIGGGFLKTPVLIVGVLLPPKIAVGTALFMIFITALFGAGQHASLGHINYLLALFITLGMMIGAYIGTSVLKKTADARIKKYIFAAILVAGILTLFR